MKDRIAIAIAGFFGAIGPSMCQFIAMTQKEPFEWPHASFYLGTFIMGVLGAGIVLVMKETTAYKAFMQGMSAPTVFSSAGTVAVSVALFIGDIEIIPSAYAMSPPQEKSTDSVEVIINIEEGDSIRVISGNYLYNIGERTTILVPRSSYLLIERGNNQTIYHVTDSAIISVKTKNIRAKKGFLQGFFPMMDHKAQQKLAPEELEVKETK